MRSVAQCIYSRVDQKVVRVVKYCRTRKAQITYGLSMKKYQVKNNAEFLTFIAAKYRQSAKVSLMIGEVIAIEVNKDLILKFDIK